MTRTTTEELLATAEQLANMGSWVQEPPAREALWSEGIYRLLGLTREEADPTVDTFLERAHPEDREAVRAFTERLLGRPESVPPEGVGIEFRIVQPDGSVRFVAKRARAQRDDSGWRCFCVTQDVTDLRLSERDLHAHYDVTQALRDWESFDEGVVVLLRRLGTALDFQAGALWALSPSGERIGCRAFWSAPHLDLRAFESATRALSFKRHEGLMGRAWNGGEIVVIPDVRREPGFQRQEVAVGPGIRSAIVFPACGPDGPLAALSFYATDRREPSERLRRTISGIGTELGMFLHRRRAQLQPGPLSRRELEVLTLAAEGLSGPDIAGRLVVSPSTVKTHFENIYEKLGVSDRAGAVAQAMRIGLVH